MKRADKYDVIRYEPKLIQAGIYQVICMISQMLDTQYQNFTDQLKQGYYQIQDVSQYTEIFNILIVNIIKSIIPYF